MPVLVGTAASGELIVWRSIAALIVAVALQISVNLANDYFDGVRGVDNDQRVGPRRMTATGAVRPEAMRGAAILAALVAAIAGVSLAAAVGWELLLVGAAAILAAFGYSGGPSPYAGWGLGEASVFIFFGLVATVGSSYVQVGYIQPLPAALAIAVGLLAVSLLVVNNTRDIATDEAAHKRTLAVRMGPLSMRRLYATCVLDPFLIVAIIAVMSKRYELLFALLVLPLALRAMRLMAVASDRRSWAVTLSATAALQLSFGIAVAALLWM